ncbi:N-(5'-phosphoribosyl)anthranilate isomerase [Sulfitobacter faviae]|uniref:N-(5'-phosphoribosyl)anthranilate isomerase n=1 Tax=Sulfitobacter faviae TaxID=1775881 RepID=A0ABZ0UUW0_9RHOB|nr:N-(5'-phosphoribosyl)anthranilate isomerase [Sulfitobacter faviae]WPZ20406.1 N-(5'-phosphoribosyl)anthranilate isomerase [Sulfitobacter faviae]
MAVGSPLSPAAWLDDIFASKAAIRGQVIRRNARDIEKFVGRQTFENELKRLGFQAAENAGQVIIFCNREPIRRIA